jgi:transposase
VAWARRLGTVEAFGIEGTGSYGVGLASYVRRQTLRVVEVNHSDRRKRRNNGKSDNARRRNGRAFGARGDRDGRSEDRRRAAEMVRQSKIARDTAVKARSTAIIMLKTLLVNAPSELREALEPLTERKLINACLALSPAAVHHPADAAQHALHALAARWLALTAEIETHDDVLNTITLTADPTLRRAFGIGPDSVAEIMIVAGDNSTRIKSEAAFANLWRVPDTGLERRDQPSSLVSRR